MNPFKTLLLSAVLACLPVAASANSIDYANTGGTVTGISGGTALTLTGSVLTSVTGGTCVPTCAGSNLGSVTFTTGALTGGSLATGGTFGAGGSFTITGNGSGGVGSGVLFTGTFTSATWSVNSSNGITAFSLSGFVKGSTGNLAFTVQTSDLVGGNPFAGGSASVSWASGNTVVVPEPGTLGLLGTGLVGLLGTFRRKLLGPPSV